MKKDAWGSLGYLCISSRICLYVNSQWKRTCCAWRRVSPILQEKPSYLHRIILPILSALSVAVVSLSIGRIVGCILPPKNAAIRTRVQMPIEQTNSSHSLTFSDRYWVVEREPSLTCQGLHNSTISWEHWMSLLQCPRCLSTTEKY